MKKLTEYVAGTVGIFIYLLFSYGEIAGIIHSAVKHTGADFIVSVIIPPWAWYRSVEMWWHNDYANIDWDKRIQADTRSSIYFMNEATNKDANTYKVNEDAEEFSSKIRKYPPEKKQFLMDCCRKYIAFSRSAMDDVLASMNNFYSSGNFSFIYSPETKRIEADLVDKYKLHDEMEEMDKYMELQAKQINEQPKRNLSGNNAEDLKETFTSSCNLLKKTNDNNYRRIFKQLFNEDL